MGARNASCSAVSMTTRHAVVAVLAALLVATARGRELTQAGGVTTDTSPSSTTPSPTAGSPYGSFADLLAPVLLLTQGNFERADQAVEQLFIDISNEIAGAVTFLEGRNPPQVHLNAPAFLLNNPQNVSTNIAGAQALAVGINYAPCAVSTSARGADVTAAGVNVNPSLIEVFAEGVAIWPWAINIQPALIYINPWGTDIAPEGISITPSLIAVAPHRVADAPAGIAVNPVGIAVP